MNYYILEIQKTAEGLCSHLVQSAPSRREAESKYHGVLQFAALSDLAVHSAALLDERGELLACQCYRREAGEEDA